MSKQLRLTDEDVKAYINGEPITYEPRMPLEANRKPAGEFPEGGSYPTSGERLKSLYGALSSIQSQLTDLEGKGHEDDWREDWRGWEYCSQCECDRCVRLGNL